MKRVERSPAGDACTTNVSTAEQSARKASVVVPDELTRVIVRGPTEGRDSTTQVPSFPVGSRYVRSPDVLGGAVRNTSPAPHVRACDATSARQAAPSRSPWAAPRAMMSGAHDAQVAKMLVATSSPVGDLLSLMGGKMRLTPRGS